MPKTGVTLKGNKEIESRLRKLIDAKQGVAGYDVGIFKGSTYPDGKKIAEVAIDNEFGTKTRKGTTHIPERPFFRSANKNFEPKLQKIIEKSLKESPTYTIGAQEMDQIGLLHAAQVQKSINAWRIPPNAPETIKRKGRDKPLIQGGDMKQAIASKTVKTDADRTPDV